MVKFKQRPNVANMNLPAIEAELQGNSEGWWKLYEKRKKRREKLLFAREILTRLVERSLGYYRDDRTRPDYIEPPKAQNAK